MGKIFLFYQSIKIPQIKSKIISFVNKWQIRHFKFSKNKIYLRLTSEAPLPLISRMSCHKRNYSENVSCLGISHLSCKYTKDQSISVEFFFSDFESFNGTVGETDEKSVTEGVP